MPAVTPIVISSAVEGIVDEAVVKRLIVEVGGEIGPIYGKRGKSLLKQRINGYNPVFMPEHIKTEKSVFYMREARACKMKVYSRSTTGEYGRDPRVIIF